MRLTPDRRLEISEEIIAEAVMTQDSVAEAEAFLGRWRRARHLMYKENMVRAQTANEVAYLVVEGASIPRNHLIFRVSV